MSTEDTLDNIIEKETSHQIQRKALGIPVSLSSTPVLYLSSHIGFLERKYPSHIARFKRTLRSEKDEDENQESVYMALSSASPDQIIDSLREIILRDDPSRKGSWLPSNTSQNDPLPGFVVNIIYLPELNDKGEAEEPSTTFAVDP